MASIATERKTGLRRVLFTGLDGVRKTIRLGKVNKRQADSIRLRIEKLVAAKITGTAPDDETSRWVAELIEQNAVLASRLGQAGLIKLPERQDLAEAAGVTLKQFIDEYIDQFGPTVKPSTVVTWNQARRLLLEDFDPDTPLRSITEGRAIEFRTYLLKRKHERIARARKLSESTIRRRCGCLRQIFDHAVALELIDKNPFRSKRIPMSLPKPKQKENITP